MFSSSASNSNSSSKSTYDNSGTELSSRDFSTYSDAARGTYHYHPSYYDGRDEESGTLKRYSRRIGVSFGVHHFIVVDTPDWYLIYEWMDDSRAHCCAAKSMKKENGICRTFGTEKIKDVWNAVKNATIGKSYSSNYNCNHWCDRVLHELIMINYLRLYKGEQNKLILPLSYKKIIKKF